MAKFYVESGSQLQVVVEADDFVEALVKAFARTTDQRPLRLADRIIVNERGFVWQRCGHELYGDEVILPTQLVLGPPESAQ